STLWRSVIVDRLKLNVLNRLFMERPLVSVTAKRLARKIADIPDLQAQMGRLRKEDGETIRAVLPGVTPGQDLEPLIEYLKDSLQADLWLPRVLGACILSVQSLATSERTEPVVDELFRTSGPQGRMSILAAHCLLIDGTPDSWSDRLLGMTK